MAETLKPCPFCGGPSRLDGLHQVLVVCDSCDIDMHINDWNHRPGESAAREAAIDECAKTLEFIVHSRIQHWILPWLAEQLRNLAVRTLDR